MKTSILWNGFEIKKADVQTVAGDIPYLYYGPQMSDQTVNIGIHGEGHEKEEWLCFNSTLKLGNLLKESIKKNSPFIAFDLYGHGDWLIEDRHFNTTHLTEKDIEALIERSINGIQEAIPKILAEEGLSKNPITLTAFSLGCSVALGLKLKNESYKTILISPFKAVYKSNCKKFYVIRGKNDQLITEGDFQDLYSTLPENSILDSYDSKHEIPESWITNAKKFIYS